MLKVSVRKHWGSFELHAQFAAPTPGVVALFGRSGCGKTTTINIIAGLLAAEEACIELDGACLEDTGRSLRVRAERRGIGYVFQDVRLFPHLSVIGNLRYGQKRAYPRAHREAKPSPEQSEVFDRTVALLGLGPLLERRPHQLSGGERQRVALGRALLARPRLLLLDEPLASIDEARRAEVLPYLSRLRDNFAIPMVYVSHQLPEVLQLATSVVLMDAGRVVAQGTVSEISLLPAFRSIVGSESVGAVLEGTVESVEPASGTAALQIGAERLIVSTQHAMVGERLRVQLLARDIILATEEPRGLSVRNALRGTIMQILPDEKNTLLVTVSLGEKRVLARVTAEALQALRLAVGQSVWVLVKAVSTGGQIFPTDSLAAVADRGQAGADVLQVEPQKLQRE